MGNVPSETRFIGFSNRANLKERKSSVANAESQPYTMKDIADTARPYKVFTAIISQSGGLDNVLINGGELTLGVTYFIDDPGSGDWTNVGAPNNDAGTYFIATGTTPNSWGDGALTYNAGTPIAIILENTLGNIWFEYREAGQYRLYLPNELTYINKLFINNSTPLSNSRYVIFNRIIDKNGSGFDVERGYLFHFAGENNIITITTISDADILSNDILQEGICIEIRVYN